MTATGDSSMRSATRVSTPETIAVSSRRPRPTTTGRWPDLPATTSGPTSIATSAPGRPCEIRGCRRIGRRSDHGAGMSAAFRLRQRRPARHVLPGDSGARRVRVSGTTFIPDATRSARALSPSRAREFAVSQPRRRTLRGQDARSARQDRPLGVVRRTRSISSATAGTVLRRQRHAHPRRRRSAAGTSRGSSGGKSCAHSPLTRCPATPFDDAWRAINHRLIHGSIASRDATCSCATMAVAAAATSQERSASTSMRARSGQSFSVLGIEP